MDQIAATLRSHYGIEPTSLEPTERGKDFAASVFRVWVAHDETPRYIVKTRPTGAQRDVAAAVAHHLADAGVPAVVAPIPSIDGALSAPAEIVALTVYPFIDGTMGIEMAMTDASWRALGAFARRLHETNLPPELAAVLPRETYRPRELDTIPRVDAALATSSASDPASRTVIELWQSRRSEILELARRTTQLGDALRRRSPPLPLVPCHADLHTGNLIVDAAGGVWVIDWDEVVLAPRERDLMFAVGGGISEELVSPNATERFLDGYGEVEVDGEALAYYRHAWAVQDVGGYAWRVLLDESATEAQRNDAASILVGLFRPGEIVDLAARERGTWQRSRDR